MRIRKYNGKDMQEALAKVRADLGVEAVILNSRKVKRRGIAAWFSKPYFEVLAAVDENFVPSPPSRLQGQTPRAESGRPAAARQAPQWAPPADTGGDGTLQPRPAGRYGAAAYQAARDISPGAPTAHLPQDPAPGSQTPPPGAPPARMDGELDQLKEQVRSMARMLEQMQAVLPSEGDAAAHGGKAAIAAEPERAAASVRMPAPSAAFVPDPGPGTATVSDPRPGTATVPGPVPSTGSAVDKPSASLPVQAAAPMPEAADAPPQITPEGLVHMRQRLVAQDFDPELAERILGKVRDLVPGNAGAEEIRKLTARVLAAALGEPETIRLRQDGKPCVVALVGPTGVGKTTTLAKLAADLSLTKGKKVGLITADTYRIAAVEQLKTYAEILNLPVSVVYTPSDMPAAIAAYADKDVILVDTAGRSHRNRQQFDELRQLLQAAPIDEVYLVLSVNTSRAACQEVLEHYSFVRDYKLLFTKLDETPVSGVIFNARLRTGKRLSYITAGQSVPDDLSVADSRGLAMIAAGTQV